MLHKWKYSTFLTIFISNISQCMKFFNIHFTSSNQIVWHNYKLVLFIGFPAAAAAYAAAYAGRGYSGYPGLLAAASYPTGNGNHHFCLPCSLPDQLAWLNMHACQHWHLVISGLVVPNKKSLKVWYLLCYGWGKIYCKTWFILVALNIEQPTHWLSLYHGANLIDHWKSFNMLDINTCMGLFKIN